MSPHNTSSECCDMGPGLSRCEWCTSFAGDPPTFSRSRNDAYISSWKTHEFEPEDSVVRFFMRDMEEPRDCSKADRAEDFCAGVTEPPWESGAHENPPKKALIDDRATDGTSLALGKSQSGLTAGQLHAYLSTRVVRSPASTNPLSRVDRITQANALEQRLHPPHRPSTEDDERDVSGAPNAEGAPADEPDAGRRLLYRSGPSFTSC